MHLRVQAALIALSILPIAVACGDSDGPTDPVGSITIETASLAEAIEGVGYSQQLEAAGGSGGYSWLLAAGSLPAGLTLAPVGAITGAPMAPGTASFRVRATDGAGRTATADLSIAVVQALTIHTATLAEGMAGEPYAGQLQAVGGRGTLTWSATGGDAASWLAVASDGTLSGTPTTDGAFSVAVAVADESGQEATRSLPIVVLAPLAVSEISLPVATQGRVYAAQLVATGGSGAYTWSVDGGALPTGTGLDGGGALTGTPTDAGAFTFTARVTDGAGRTATRSLSLTVERAPTIQTQTLPPADVGVAYSAQLTATGGTGTHSWSVTDGAPPDGLTLSTTGSISGTPNALGSATFTVQVTDEAFATHSRAFTIVVAEIQPLTSGAAVTGIDGEAESVRYYAIDVPAGATGLTVAISGGTGDADLYVRRTQLPEQFSYDCRPLRDGNEETCTFTSPAAGQWYIMLRGFTAYSGLQLMATVQP